jgi:PAS domain S-box-containing protein
MKRPGRKFMHPAMRSAALPAVLGEVGIKMNDRAATANIAVSALHYEAPPELQLIYDTAPVGLAFLTPDCRYLQVNQRVTEICGISVADHIGRSVRETVPQVADQVESIVQTVMRTGEPLTDVEINGQRPDGGNALRFWLTSWHPLKAPDGRITGVSVVAEEITERKRAEAELAASANALRESEARFRELADNMSQFAWTADAAGWIYWYNQRWYDYSGTSLAEMQGWGWRKIHHPEHVERVVRRIRRCFETGAPWEDTFPLRGRDGNYRWFLSRALPIRDKAGDIVRWFGTNTDVTEQIRAESELRELNATLRQRVDAETQERLRIWNVSQDLLMVADQEGKYLSVNPAWTATLGWSESDLLGKSSQWLLHPDDRDSARMQIEHLAGGERTQRFESRYRHKDGSYRVLSWRGVLHHGRIYAMARDITELKQTEQALQRSQRELARVTGQTTVAAMTASIAHELNQPLSAIVSSANAGIRWLAKTEPDIPEAQAVLKRIVDNGHRAADIISSIRALFRHDDHKKGPLDVNDLVREVVVLVHGEIESHQAVLQVELLDGLP